MRLTKPRYELADGKLRLVPNPVASLDELKRLQDARFINEIGRRDWWYNLDNHPTLRFPYSKILLNKRMWLEAWYDKADQRVDDVDPRPWTNLWDNDEAKDILTALLDAFVEDARSRDAIPLILLMPIQAQVRYQVKTGKVPANAAVFLEISRTQGYTVFNGVEALSRHAESPGEVKKLYKGHLSALGNRMIAQELAAFMTEQGLWPEGSPSSP